MQEALTQDKDNRIDFFIQQFQSTIEAIPDTEKIFDYLLGAQANKIINLRDAFYYLQTHDLINNEDIERLKNICSHTIEVSSTSTFVHPILYTIPVQLLAYYTAVLKGTDIDQPRNLAKSVTVE